LISFCTSSQTKLSITEYDCIDDIAGIWDLILPRNHSLLSKNLRVVENARPDEMGFKYLLVHKNESLCGVVYLQHLKVKPSHFDGSTIDKPGLGWLKKCVNNQFSDMLICGNIFRIHFPGYFFKNPKDENLIFEVLTDFIKSNKENGRFCGILLKDCPEPLTVDRKFKPYHDDVTMELTIREEWESFEDYKNDLSKKYLQRCRKIQKARELLQVKTFTCEDILENSSRIQDLYLNVAMKQSLRIGFINSAYFYEMKKCYGDQFILNGYYLDNELVAFSSHILYPNDKMEIHYIGLNYAVNEQYCLYFNILFDGLKLAIENNKKQLELGRTARLAKASLGALPLQVHNYIFLKSGVPSLAFSFFSAWFLKKIGEEWTERNPFKSTSFKETELNPA